MLREAEVFTLSGEGVHFDRNMHQHSKLFPGIKAEPFGLQQKEQALHWLMD